MIWLRSWFFEVWSSNEADWLVCWRFQGITKRFIQHLFNSISSLEKNIILLNLYILKIISFFFLLSWRRYHLKPLRGQIIFCSIHCWWMEDKKLLTEEKRERDCCSLRKNLILSLSLSLYSSQQNCYHLNLMSISSAPLRLCQLNGRKF